MKWNNLTMSQKQALMKIYVNNGVTNLDEIVNHYNRYAEGGSKETVESPNAVMYSRTPRESVGNIVNTRPVPSLITMTEVPRIGAGINLPFKELIDRFVLEKTNAPNIINTDSITRPVSYITRPSRINRFDDGGDTKTQFDSDFYIDETDIEPVIYNKQYWYQQTPQYQEDLKNHYKQHNDSMLPFYESLKGGKYDDVYNEAINILNKEGNNNIDTAQTIYKYGTPEYEELFGMSEDYRYNNNIPIFFADDIQVPSSFRPENAYDKFVNDNIKNPMNYVSSLYNTRRAKRNIRRANRYALKHGASEYFTEFSPIEKITPTLSYDGTATYYDPNYDQISVDLTPAQSKYTLSTKTDVAHEAAHTRNLYNTTDPLHKFLNNRKDSPYYGNIYDYINSKHKKWLTPMKTPDNHDLELNESYSDLMGLRMALYDSGIVDGTKKRYRNKHIKEYLNTQEGANDRYLLLHPNIRQTRKALNRVWSEGGKLNKNKK